MKKKTIFKVISSFLVVVLLSSCSLRGPHLRERLFDDDREVANARMDKVLEAIKNKDKDALRNLFSKNAIASAEDFDKSIEELFEFFKGDFISYDDRGGVGASGSTEDGERKKELESTYDVETSEQKYRFAVLYCTIDTANKKNIGISSLYIIKSEDTNERFAYRGDNKWTPGINFNKDYEPEDGE